jgi:hypothetical protein
MEKEMKLHKNRVHSNELDHDSCSCALDIDIDHAGLDSGFSHDGFHLAGDVVEAVVGGGWIFEWFFAS